MELTTVSGDLGDVFPDTEFDLNTDLYVNPTQMKSVLRAGKEFVNPDRYIDEEGDYHPAVYIVHEEVTTVNENGEFETLRSGGEPKSYTAEELFADNADFKILNIDKSFADINVNLLEGEEAGKVYLYAKDNYIKAVAGLRVNVNTKRFNLKKFECVTYGEFLAQTTLGVKAEIEYQKNLDKKVAKFGKCTSVFWVGLVPVAITSEIGLRVKGGFEFNGECDIYTNLDFHANYELGAVYENGWITKAIEHEGELVGFTMYGYNEEEDFYELCRIMIAREHQGKGYGTQAIKLVLEEMKVIEGCKEVYLSTDPENIVGKHIYEKIGFASENKMLDAEELYKYVF
jgi:diamine N-acetyltransferase